MPALAPVIAIPRMAASSVFPVTVTVSASLMRMAVWLSFTVLPLMTAVVSLPSIQIEASSTEPLNTFPRTSARLPLSMPSIVMSPLNSLPSITPLTPASIRSAVDLPQPDGPAIDTYSPCWISR